MAKVKTIVTLSEKDFEYFRAKVLHYRDEFNLRDWELWFEFKSFVKDHDDLATSDEEYIAQTSWDIENHQATVTLACELPGLYYCGKTKKEVLERVARHEMFHLVICLLHSYSMRRFVGEKDIDYEIERLVRALEGIYSSKK